ncbi:MAG: hypothetical protein JWO06_1185 [Bacteroidota bacterium]|nr:hypothetical protein [Bacteroidota bacterium]
MKKVLIFLLFLSIQSCKKDWNCACQLTVTNAYMTTTSTDDFPIQNATHASAVKDCNASQATLTQTYTGGTTTNAVCTIH